MISEPLPVVIGDLLPASRCNVCNADTEEKARERCRFGCKVDWNSPDRFSRISLHQLSQLTFSTHRYIIDTIRGSEQVWRVDHYKSYPYDVVQFLRHEHMTSAQAIQHQFRK